MRNTIFSVLLIALTSCGTIQNKYQLEEDDIYYSRNQNGNKAIITPNVDVDKIMQQYPSKIKEGTFDNRPTEINPNAASAYQKYKIETDTLYKQHPELSSSYNPYKAPVFDEREEARRLRRLNRMYNNNNYSNSYVGYNGYNNGWNNYGYNRGNRFLQGWNFGFGLNSFNGFNYGAGYNSGWGNNFYYNPWNNYGYNNFYYPNNNWGYNPYYGGYNPYYDGYNYGYYNPYYQPVIIDNRQSPPPPINCPREVTGSDIPPTKTGRGGLNTVPRTGQLGTNPGNDVSVPNQPQEKNATLKRDEIGNYQYTPPSNYNRATGTSEAPDNRNNSDYNSGNSNNVPSNRNENNAMPNNQRNNPNNYQQTQPNNNNQYQQQTPRQPNYNAPSTPAPTAPRNGGSSGGGGKNRPR